MTTYYIPPESACAQTCEIRYVKDNASTDSLNVFAYLDGKDKPTPLPLYPDDSGEMSRLPETSFPSFPQLTTDEDGNLDALLSRVYEEKFIEAARGIEADGKILIAALTSPFYLKSERDRARQTLENDLRELFGNEDIILAFDLDLYRRIDDNMTEEEALELYETALLRR